MDVYSKAAHSIIGEGYAIIKLPSSLLSSIDEVFQEGLSFFEQNIDNKIYFSTPSTNEGYLLSRSEHSGDQRKPDLCESFCLWGVGADKSTIHPWSEKSKLYNLMNDIFLSYQKITDEILHSIKIKVNPNGIDVKFSSSSCLQLNFYRPYDTNSNLLQDAHEDGQLITLLRPTARGIEILVGGDFVEPVLNNDEVIVMPGSIITAMTAGLIKPLVHRVRNFQHVNIRQSLMYFVSQNITEETLPWCEGNAISFPSIKESTIKNSSNFGHPSIAEISDASDYIAKSIIN